MKKCKSARVRTGYKSPEGKASDYIRHFVEIAYSGIKVILYPRVSGRTQNRRGNLKAQEFWSRNSLKSYKVEIIDAFCETASGWANDRTRLIAAAELAKREEAVLVAVSTDRFIRSKAFTTDTNPDVLPTVEEYEALIEDTQGVLLATLLPPDTPWRKVHPIQIKMGQKFKGRKGGRPLKKPPGHKKQKRLANGSKVLWMDFCSMSERQIEKNTGIPRRTIRRWIKSKK
ncbi:MAG: recombinase family protein [Pirellulales bacterium]|nr:recombinase family protein [Pirellulales bacterium]